MHGISEWNLIHKIRITVISPLSWGPMDQNAMQSPEWCVGCFNMGDEIIYGSWRTWLINTLITMLESLGSWGFVPEKYVTRVASRLLSLISWMINAWQVENNNYLVFNNIIMQFCVMMVTQGVIENDYRDPVFLSCSDPLFSFMLTHQRSSTLAIVGKWSHKWVRGLFTEDALRHCKLLPINLYFRNRTYMNKYV